MEDINKHCDDNLGGVQPFKFIPVDDIASMVEPINSKVLEPVTLKALARWFNCYATEGTIKYNEEKQQSPHGDYYKAKLTAFIPKDRAEVIEQLKQMNNKLFVIDYTDNNGLRKLVGTIDNPLSFSDTIDTGDNASKRNGYTIEFSGELLKKAPTYFI